MKGYSKQIRIVDLTREKSHAEVLTETTAKQFIGGVGLASFLLYKYAPPGIDPFSPLNPLIFSIGPLAGSPIPCSSKFAVAAKSPLTGLIGYGLSSGFFGMEMRRTGCDAIVFSGHLKKPGYVVVRDHDVEFIYSKSIWGSTSTEAEEQIKEEVGDRSVNVATIGQGGEHLVRYASINNDQSRQVGRTGLGAVMGSKKLKGVAVCGSNEYKPHDLESMMALLPTLIKKARGPATKKYRIFGTAANVLILHNLGALPTYNFQQSTFEEGSYELSGENMIENFKIKDKACGTCPIACDHVCAVDEGPYKGATASIEYETIFSLGTSCGITSMPAVIKANQLCDEFGLDTLSTGISISFAMEAFQKGIITPRMTKGLKIKFGDPEVVMELIKRIAFKKDIGSLLAEGTRIAAQKLGHDSIHFAMQIKGMEIPGYMLRTLKAAAIGFATSTRGACHLRNAAYSYDVSGKFDRFKADPANIPEIRNMEDFYAIYDSIILCKFIRGVISNCDLLIQLYELATGIEMTNEQILEAGERIYTLQEAYNIREGQKLEDFYLPPRCYKDPVPDGPGKGIIVTKKEFEDSLQTYFKNRGWSKTGKPLKDTLVRLGLLEVANELYLTESKKR